MTLRRKRLVALPALIVLYMLHPILGLAGVVSGFVGLFFVRRALEGMTSTA